MAVAAPRPAAPPPAATPTRPARVPLVLLVGVMACFVYGCFAAGATTTATERWFGLGLTVLAAIAVGAWAYARSGVTLRPSRLGVAGLVALTLFGAFNAAGIAWSVTPDRSWSEANVTLAFALCVLLGMVVGSSLPRATERVLVALAIAVLPVALYALSGKTLPGLHLGSLIDLNQTGRYSRLRAPLDYWNALALVMVTGALPLLRLAADPARSRRGRLAALVGLYVTLLVLALTYSRGGILALIVGVLVLLALSTERVRTLLLGASAAVAMVIPLSVALSYKSLNFDNLPVSVRTGDSFVVFLVVVAVGALLWLWGRMFLALERDARFSPARGRALGRRAAQGAAAAVAVAVIVLVVSGQAASGVRTFKNDTDTAAVTEAGRVLSGSSANRWTWWRQSAAAFSVEPLRGWGGGSFPVTQRLYRTSGSSIEQPHSVPLQWLAENGLVGFLLAVGALLALLATALARVRSLPTALAGAPPARGAAAALLAVAAAWVAQSFFEWSWDIPAVTLPMLFCLGVLAARPTGEPGRAGAARGPVLVGALLAAVLFGTSLMLPALAASKAESALVAAGSEDLSASRLLSVQDQALYASRLNPVAVDGLQVAAIVAERRGRLDLAQRYLLRAVGRQPYDVETWIELGRIASLTGDREAVVAIGRKVLALDPGTESALDVARIGLENLVPPADSATATGTPLVTTVTP